MDIRPLHPCFGAEVRGFDLFGEVSSSEVELLRAAFAEHQLLLFRLPAALPPERQVAITGWFGPLADNSGDGQFATVLDNAEPSGSARLKFHSDFSYTDCPIKGISLQALALPPGGTATAFVSGVHGWASLPETLKTIAAPLTARHVQETTLVTERAWPTFVADQPLRLVHPVTGQPVLYITEYHVRQINELGAEDGTELLHRLFAHLYAPEHVYVHRWQLHDLLIWDNLALQHARPEAAEPERGRRVVQRVALNEVSFAELTERAWARQRAGEPALGPA